MRGLHILFRKLNKNASVEVEREKKSFGNETLHLVFFTPNILDRLFPCKGIVQRLSWEL